MKNLRARLTKIILKPAIVNSFIVLAIVGGYYYLLSTGAPSSEQSMCLFKNITSIPCPGCGMGRSTWFFVRAQFAESFFWHPLGIVFNGFMIVALMWAIKDIHSKSDSLYQVLRLKWPNYILIPFILMVLIVWLRNIVVGI